MAQPDRPDQSTSRRSARLNLSGWAVAGTILLVIVALIGWLVYGFNRLTGQTAISQATPTTTLRPSAGNIAPPVITGPLASPGLATTLRPTVSAPLAYGVVISKTLNLRGGPTTDAPVLSSLKSGEIVELIRRSGGWYQTINGSWISALFLEVRATRAEAESYSRELTAA